MSRPRPAAARALGATLAALLAGPPASAALESLELRLGNLRGDGWSAAELILHLDLGPDGAPRAGRLRAARLELQDAGLSLRDLDIRCPRIHARDGSYRCAAGEIQARLPMLGLRRAAISLAYLPAQRRLELRLEDPPPQPLGLRAEALWTAGGPWSLHLQGADVPLERLAERAAGLWPADWTAAGRLDLDARISGAAGEQPRSLGELRWSALGFSGPQGLRAAEALEGQVQWQARRRDGAWNAFLETSTAAGQLYLDPVFVDFSSHPLEAQGLVRWDPLAGLLEGLEVVLNQRELVDLRGDLRLAWPSMEPRRAALELRHASLPAAYDTYLAPLLAGRTGGALKLGGSLSGELLLDAGEPRRLQLRLARVEVASPDARHNLEGLDGTLHWSAPHEPPPPTSRLQWAAGRLFGLPVGSAALEASLQGGDFRLTHPARIPVLDGAVEVQRLAATEMHRPARSLLLDAQLTPVSLTALTRALGWPEFSGSLSARLPELSYRDNAVTLGGALSAEAFDGRVSVERFRLRDPLGARPVLEGEVQLQGLDLERLTRTFRFGRITGRLDGDIQGLRLVGWQPAAFRAWFATPEDDRSRHRISQRAVENLASLGGAGAGAALSRGLLGLFEEFRYDRIGLGCVLKEDICLMRGLGPAESGYYIVRGAGLPRVDVIGHSRAVRWSTLVRQLQAVTAAPAPVVE